MQIGIGGWQVPRPAVEHMVSRRTNIFTMEDIEDLGIPKVAEMALERAWDGADAVYMSYDIDSLEAAFVPGTGWPSRADLPREALKLVGLVAAEGLCGMEVVEVSPVRRLGHHLAHGAAHLRGRHGEHGRKREDGRAQAHHRQGVRAVLTSLKTNAIPRRFAPTERRVKNKNGGVYVVDDDASGGPT